MDELNVIISNVGKSVIVVLEYPFRVWVGFPGWVRFLCFVLGCFVVFFVLRWVFFHRDDWLEEWINKKE